ncbi:MAG TPA: hypothetical protein VFZ65_19465 [Planctomycetota bacterium]|nr:hypothetical protein [Planctomycetota bacterium]
MLLTPLLGVALLVQGPSLTANVDDPMSHGVVHDGVLSIDEAIRLANGSLAIGALSAAEQARLVGTGTSVDEIVVDAAATPSIVLQGPLSDVMDSGMPGAHLLVRGNGGPMILGGAQARVFTLRSRHVTVAGFRIHGGQVAIDASMPAAGTPMPEMAMVMDCELDGQTTAGVHLHGAGSDESMLMVRATTFANMPLGFQLTDQTSGGQVMAECEFLAMDGVTKGCRVDEGGSSGLSMFMLFRSTFTNGQKLAEARRTPGTKQFMFRFVHTDVHCTGDVLDIEGSATGLTMIHHHHSDFTAGPGGKAFWVWPRTAEFDVHGSEMEFTGDVSIAANLATMRVWQQNNHYRNGTITLDVDGALPNLLWNRYTNCTIDVPATARSPVAIRSSELDNTNVQSASFLAPITLQGCRRTGGGLTGFASETTPAPAPFLGTTTVAPTDPQIGTSLTLGTDLPFGIGLVWDIALSYARPTTTLEPVRFYGDPSTVIVLPALLLFQSQMTVPLPNDNSLVGVEFYAQGISLPLLGQAYAPAYHLPRGSLLRLRL